MKRGLSHANDDDIEHGEIDWDRLRVFRAVAKTGSMSAAAQILGGSPPTISRRISDLELALQTELFRRGHTGVVLTKSGQALLRHADIIADTVKAAQDDVAVSAMHLDSRLHLVCPEALSLFWVVPRLAELQRSHLDVRLDLSLTTSSDELIRTDADLMLQFERPTNPDLVTQRIGRCHYIGAMSATSSESTVLPSSLEDMARIGAMVHADYLAQAMRSGSALPGETLLRQMQSFMTLMIFCQSGVAPALVPTYLLAENTGLTPCPGTHGPSLDLWLCYPPRLRRKPRGRLLLEWLQKIFSTTESEWFRQVDVTRDRAFRPQTLEAGPHTPALP